MDNAYDIWRDKNGIPHIEAATLSGMYKGQGYAHARDRGMHARPLNGSLGFAVTAVSLLKHTNPFSVYDCYEDIRAVRVDVPFLRRTQMALKYPSYFSSI